MSNNDDFDDVPDIAFGGGFPLSMEEEELMESIDGPGVRIFSMATSNRSIIGIVISENSDSFLVAMPCVVMKDTSKDNAPVVRSYLPVPFFRLMKSSIENICFAFAIFKDLYLEYLEHEGYESQPSMQEIIDLILDEESEEPSTVSVSAEEAKTLQDSVEAMEQKLQELHNSGVILIDLGNAKVKH